jgi:hypothetical protein
MCGTRLLLPQWRGEAEATFISEGGALAPEAYSHISASNQVLRNMWSSATLAFQTYAQSWSGACCRGDQDVGQYTISYSMWCQYPAAATAAVAADGDAGRPSIGPVACPVACPAKGGVCNAKCSIAPFCSVDMASTYQAGKRHDGRCAGTLDPL